MRVCGCGGRVARPAMTIRASERGTEREITLSRRELLLRTGVLGAGAVVGGLWPSAARATVPDALRPLLAQVADPAIQLLVRDTYAGLAVFAVPGPDPYSQAQRVTTAAPGGVEAVPIPHSLLGGALSALELVGATMDDVLRLALANDETVPASLPLALLMNFAATQVRPSSVVGPIPSSPFANLTWSEKGLAFERIEQADPAIVALIDANAPQPLKEGASGLLRFVGNAMLVFAPFAGYSEYGVFDRSTLRATRRPIGWDLSRYMPGRTTPADGWPEFLGYYQDRRETHTAPEFGGP